MLQQPTTIRYRTMAWLTIASGLAYLCRNAIGVAESSVREDLGLTLQQSGWFLGAFFWSYALFQVPCGWFAQRRGTRFALTVFAVGWSIAAFGLGVAPGFALLIIAQLIMGISQAGIFPAACNSIGHWFPMSRRTLACGILCAGMQVGAIAASGLTGVLLQSIDWRWVFILFSLPGIVWATGFAISFRDRPEQLEKVNDEELKLIHAHKTQRPDGTHAPIGEHTNDLGPPRTSAIIFLCGQQICRASGYMFFASWFPTFLQATRGVSIETSGFLQSLVLCGTLAGSLSGGFITDWIWQRTGSQRLSRSGMGSMALCVCGLLVLSAWLVSDVSLAIALLSLGSFFAALAGPPTFASTIDLGGTKVPQLMGLVNMCGNLAAAACPVLVGMLFEWTANWNLVLLLFAGIYLLGGVCWALVAPHAPSPRQPDANRTPA
ncbi:MFS transporter [Rosistilla oblonga]|uniref:MFS transporter n=1 Tax=Rosistilla oblonga TaxID=2527990 RepID=UPI003A9763F3